MKKHFAIALAATMVVGGMSVRSFADDSPAVDAQQKAAQAAQQAGNQGGTAAQNAGSGAAAAAQNLADRAERASDEVRQAIPSSAAQVDTTANGEDVQNQLSKLADAVLQPGQLNQAVQQYLVKADQKRIGEIKVEQTTDYDQAVTQLRQDFKAKYNQDLNLGNANEFTRSRAIVATVTDPSALRQWPVSSERAEANQAVTAGEKIAGQYASPSVGQGSTPPGVTDARMLRRPARTPTPPRRASSRGTRLPSFTWTATAIKTAPGRGIRN